MVNVGERLSIKFKRCIVQMSMFITLVMSFGTTATIITIDNTDTGFTFSGFNYSRAVTGYIGVDYMFDKVNSLGDFATWDPTSNAGWVAGLWDVDMNWTQHNNRAKNAEITHITINSGPTTQLVNQSLNGGIWNNLGQFNFSLTSAKVTIDDKNSVSGAYIIADAVRFTLVTPATVPISVSSPSIFPQFLVDFFNLNM
jgi:hypothetical protein